MGVKKVIIPAAGRGTRFLPAAKAMPKEMLPIIDKPIIQYVVEEAVASGITDIAIVTGWQKRSIEDHFDNAFELEKHLESHGKYKELAEIKRIAQLANFVYIRQKGENYGNAIPILAARAAVDSEPFAVMWGNEFIISDPPRLKQMINAYEKHGGVMISAVRVEDQHKLARYGVADIEPVGEGVFVIKKIVEKPKPGQAPSSLAMIGAYILPPEIFKAIEKLKPGKDGEFWLVDAINDLSKQGVPIYACEVSNGRYYDTGNKLEYLKTVIEFALAHPEFSDELKKYLKELGL